jgi:hypothetical protein
LGFKSQQRLGILLFTTTSIMAVGFTQSPIQWVPKALSLGGKQPQCEDNHSLPSSGKDKNAWSYIFTPPVHFMVWFSVKAQGQLYLYCLIS